MGSGCNAGMRAKEMREFCEMDGGTKELLKAAIARFNLSGRGYDRTLKVSRTIADLEGAQSIEMHHVAEAINYRAFNRKLFNYKRKKQTAMQLLTWNIRCQNTRDDACGCGWDSRRQRVVDTICALSPDVLAVQEARAAQFDDLRAALPDYDCVGVGRDDGERAGEFCGLFFRRARFALLSTKTRWLSPTPDVVSRGWDASLNRIATSARLFDHKVGREIEVWNTHFDHLGALARLNSAKLLRRELEASPRPVVLCGDFNASPASAPIAELSGSSLRDARAHSKCEPGGEVATFCGFGTPVVGEAARIDYVFVSGEWIVESYRVDDPGVSPGPPASDHRPVVVELSLS